MAVVLGASQDNQPEYISGRPNLAESQNFQKEFVCPEESMRYASSLEQLVFSRIKSKDSKPTIIEFGSGTGEPVIAAILNSKFSGVVHGYEINPEAADKADDLIHAQGLTGKYIVHPVSFFDNERIPQSDYLIANPPYLPCEDRSLLILPDLCGGKNGNDVSRKLLSCGFKNVFLEVSSYSDPVAVISHALSLGYQITDFQITQMPLGVYSRQEVVQKRLQEMRESGNAFYTNNCYLVGSAFFTKEGNDRPDLSNEFLASLTAVGRAERG